MSQIQGSNRRHGQPECSLLVESTRRLFLWQANSDCDKDTWCSNKTMLNTRGKRKIAKSSEIKRNLHRPMLKPRQCDIYDL